MKRSLWLVPLKLSDQTSAVVIFPSPNAEVRPTKCYSLINSGALDLIHLNVDRNSQQYIEVWAIEDYCGTTYLV